MGDELRVVEVRDERTQLARDAIELLQAAIGDVQPAADLLSEIEECRRGLPSGGDYHLLVALDDDGEPAAAAAGVYLEAVNAGFITYLAVRPDVRNQQLGRKLRAHLLECFHHDANRSTKSPGLSRYTRSAIGKMRLCSSLRRSSMRSCHFSGSALRLASSASSTARS